MSEEKREGARVKEGMRERRESVRARGNEGRGGECDREGARRNKRER